MTDRPALDPAEAAARETLVSIAGAMLAGTLPYHEGAAHILRLQCRLGGVADRDDDFSAFVLIASECDHLPLAAQRHLWAPGTLARLEPEIVRIQQWASSFAAEPSAKLIARFGAGET